MVGIAQLVSAPDCGSGGPGFESLYPPCCGSNNYRLLIQHGVGNQISLRSDIMLGYRQAVRHGILIPAFVGSNPTSPAVFKKFISMGY